MMGKRCAIKGCTSGYPAQVKRLKLLGIRGPSMFSAPKDPILLEQWNRAIGQNNKILTSKDSLCELHFHDDDIIKYFETRMPDGSIHRIKRERYERRDTAIPIDNSENTPQDNRGREKPAAVNRQPLQSIENIDDEDPAVGPPIVLQESLIGATSTSAVLHGDKRPSEDTIECESDLNHPPIMNDSQISKNENDRTSEIDGIFTDSSFSGDDGDDRDLDPEEYSIQTLLEDLARNPLREGWAWSRVNSQEIAFMQFHPASTEAKLYCRLIDDNRKMIISLGDRSVSREVDVSITSYAEVIEVLQMSEEIDICVGTLIDDERRSPDCWGFIEPDEQYLKKRGFQRCNPCRALRHKLQKKSTRAKTTLAAKKSVVLKKLDLLNRRHKTLLKKVSKLKTELATAWKECRTRNEEIVQEAITSFPSNQREAVQACLSASKVKSSQGRRYTKEWIYSCLLLRIKSKKAYCHVRDHDILPLPHPDTLGRYIKNMGSAYGFQQSMFDCMKEKASEMTVAERRGTLLVDEMKLSENISLDRGALTFTGFTFLGDHTPESQKHEMGDHALIFMFQPFKGLWVQALACFLSKGCAKSNVLQKLMLECVVLIERADFFVDAIISDGASWNRGVWNLLGVNEGSVSCRHPCDVLEDIDSEDSEATDNATEGGRRLWFLSDFPHLIKTMRNALTSREETLTPDGTIKLAHWDAVVHAQKYAGSIIRVAYLREDHVRPKHYQKMSVPMAFELFSKRTQVAMKLLKDASMPALMDCHATLIFMKRVNDLITAMMSRSPINALRRNNAQMKAIEDFQEYLEEWEVVANDNRVSYISRETLTGLKVSLQSVVEIFHFLQGEYDFSYVMTARLNQDALERFNGLIRSACGSNDHPNTTVCPQVFRLLSMYSLIRPPRGSCVSGPQILRTLINLKDVQDNDELKRKWLQCLDETVDNAHVVQAPSESENGDLNDAITDVSCEELSTYARAYMAGYVGRKMTTAIIHDTRCTDCLNSLKSVIPQERDKMIRLMSTGDLLYPSQALFQLLKEIDHVFMEVIGPGLNLHAERLFTVMDRLSKNESIPLVGCEIHREALTRRIVHIYIVSMGHFVGQGFNRIHSNNREKTKKFRKNAKL